MRFIDTPFCAESWNIAIRRSPCGSVLQDRNKPFAVQRNPLRYWIAAPLLFDHNGHTYLFAEMYDYLRCRGIIGVSEYKNGSFSKWKPVLIEPFHCSYPFVFSQNGEVYMIPETGAARQLRLYRAKNFPFEWELVRVLVADCNLADTTLYKSGNQWCGYTQSQDNGGENLHIALDADLTAVYLEPEHQKDISHYRPGGHIFSTTDGFVRVCQDCEKDYGAALIFRHYTQDKEVSSVRIIPEQLSLIPPILAQGIHTYTANETLEVIDIKTRRFNIINLLFRLLSKVGIHV